MSESPVPPGLLQRFIRGCFWVLAAVLALTLAVDLLRTIWPWLLGMALAIAATAMAWRMWLISQQNRY